MARKILVLTVDDDPTTTTLVKSFLKSEGYDAISASDGAEALEKIKNEKPDLVVLDIIMPETSGYDICYELRFNKDFKEIPIVLLTVKEQELNEDIGEKINIEYIQKPLNKDVLLEKIKLLLSKQSK